MIDECDRPKTPDPTPGYVAAMRAAGDGLFLVRVNGKRIVGVSPCWNVVLLPPPVDAPRNTSLYLERMFRRREGLFLAQVAAGEIVGVGTVGVPLRVAE